MDETSTQQIYDLALDILRDVTELEASIDELLVEMRIANRDMSLGRQRWSEVSQNFPRANAFQNTFGGGSNDGFVAKVDEYPVATARGTDPDWMIRSLPLAVLTPNSSL